MLVVVEAVQHYMDERMSPKLLPAMKDISAPVIAMALIWQRYLSSLFIPGIVGRLYQQFAITIAISVLISAFVAFINTRFMYLILKP